MREPILPLIIEKIREMEIIGLRSASEVRRHLKTYVVNELFKGEEPPFELSRRYHPIDSDTRNILYSSRMSDRKAPDDQVNLEIKCKEWKELNPDDFIFYRVVILNLFFSTRKFFLKDILQNTFCAYLPLK